MGDILSLIGWLSSHAGEILAAVNGLLGAAISLALLIPGEQPEKALQSVVDWLSKFSRK